MNTTNTAVVLAGGKSTRMSFNKQAITIDGRLIAVFIADQLSLEFDKVIINSNSPSLYKDCPYQVISDSIAGCGPLSGIYTALCASDSDYVYFTGCDMPFVNLSYIRYLRKQLDASANQVGGIITTTRGMFEPLNCFYSKLLAPHIMKQLRSGERQISKIYDSMEMLYVSEEIVSKFDPEGVMFLNLNTLEDFDKYLFYGDLYRFEAI